VGHPRHTGPRLHTLTLEVDAIASRRDRGAVAPGQLITRRRRGVPGPPGNSRAAITRNSTKPAKQRSESSMGMIVSRPLTRYRETVLLFRS